MFTSTALVIQRRKYNEPNLLDEFESLARTAGFEIIGSFDITTPPSAKYGISKGKVDEITTWIEVNEPDFVLFTPFLRSSQVFRLMEEWSVEVRDRTQVILEIFARHAKTQQAKLQIEKARLEYELPFERHQIRIRLQNEHTGDRPTTDQVGVGEDLVTKRMTELRRRISTIQKKLEKIQQVQELKKKKRSGHGFVEVTLAGYTNAGKSTLHNALTDSGVEIADSLFTTLGTKAAELDVKGRDVILSDSVGFISDLPHELLQAFNTTLMEISEANIIVLVVDASDSIEEMKRKFGSCLVTFSEIGANGIPIVIALNKIDLLEKHELDERVQFLSQETADIMPISAQEGINLDNLVQKILSKLPQLGWYKVKVPIGNTGMSILSWLHEIGIVNDTQYGTDSIEIHVQLNSVMFDRLAKKTDCISIDQL